MYIVKQKSYARNPGIICTLASKIEVANLAYQIKHVNAYALEKL